MDSDPYPPDLLLSTAAALPAMQDYMLFVVLVILIILNAIISGSEVAYFLLNEKNDVHHSNGARDKETATLSSLENSEKLLASIAIAYNALNVAIAATIVLIFDRFIYLSGNPLTNLLITVAVSFVIIFLFVEIMPKIYARHNPERFVKRSRGFIGIVNRTMSPFAVVFVKVTRAFNRSMMQQKHEISMDDLSKALEITSGEITHEQEKDMLEGIIRFRDKTVDDILISRIDMVALDLGVPFTEAIKYVIEAGFSRIPVYEENPDNIKGILYVKDLLPYLNKPDTFHWQSLIRQAYFVPATKRIDSLLEEFRANKNHMAIVVDEYGGTMGLVTMEDILEEIVGDISDEYDEETKLYTITPDGSYLFEGKTTLEEFVKIAGVPESDFAKMEEEVDTLAGLMLEIKGDFPKRKESVTYKQYTFQAEEMSKRRIAKVRFVPPPK